MVFKDKKGTEQILEALAAQMKEQGLPHLELLICGGSALNIVGFLERTTKDVDVVAMIERDIKGKILLHKGSEAIKKITDAITKVTRDFNLPDGWMNSGPESVLDFGLPKGFEDRVETKEYSDKLTLHFLGRLDQICFKLYAAVDQGAGKHLDDLTKLKPTSEEIETAARWSMTHDVSEPYKESTKILLEFLGFNNVAKRV